MALTKKSSKNKVNKFDHLLIKKKLSPLKTGKYAQIFLLLFAFHYV